jgi:hypothetical protein
MQGEIIGLFFHKILIYNLLNVTQFLYLYHIVINAIVIFFLETT